MDLTVKKGTKIFCIYENIETNKTIDTFLGVWISRHNFEINVDNQGVVNWSGEFDVQIWYGHNNNQVTDIAKKTIKYNGNINPRDVATPINDKFSVIGKILNLPECVDYKVKENSFDIQVNFRVSVEVIGEVELNGK